MTPINIFTIWQALMSEVNVQQGGQIRPVQDFQNWYNAVSLELFREKVAKAEINQMTDDDLSPFLLSMNISVGQVSGQRYGLVPYPANYEGFSNMRVLRPKGATACACDGSLPIMDKGKCVQVVDPDYAEMAARFAGTNLAEFTMNKVDNQAWGNCLQHDTKGPTFDSPKLTQYSSGFQVAPAGISIVVLDYYRLPRSAVFAYTVSNDDIVIYDSNNSVQLEWSSTLENEFLTRLKKKYALHVHDSETYQMAVNDKKELVP